MIFGYPPIFWFNDSYNYLYDAVTHQPDAVRPNGYPFLLDLLLPLHSAYPLAVLQAAMGVAIGVAIYALLRHRGLPWWGAALPPLPVLFDSYELHLEHQVTADTLFIFLATIAVVILCWSDRPSVMAMAVAGLFIGYATVVRSVGEPLLIVALVGMLARRVGWRRLATLAVAGIVPVGAYMIWFHSTYGHYALTESSGTFLYSRVSAFADCAKINPPARLQILCDPTPPNLRPPSGEYIWANNELGPYKSKTTPLWNKTQSDDTAMRFTPMVNGLAGQFAKDAIFAQPSDYLSVVTHDTLHTFGWNRQPDPDNIAGNGTLFRFVSSRSELTNLIPTVRVPTRHAVEHHRAHRRRGRGGPLAPLGRPRPAALAGRGGADRAAADDRRVQLSVRARRGARRLPGGRAGLRPRGQVSARPGGRSAAAPWPRRRCRGGIASAACRVRPRRAPAPARHRTAPSRSRWLCRCRRR